LAILGIPPQFRGQTSSGRNPELTLKETFPNIALFCEKPVTTGEHEEIEDAFKVEDLLQGSGIVTVGYMLRYLEACQDIKCVIGQCGDAEVTKPGAGLLDGFSGKTTSR
jgi:hypothetical protein